MARPAFVEVLPAIADAATPLDAWGGWAGEGLGDGQSLYLTTGERQSGASGIFKRHKGGAVWINDNAPTDPTAETVNKIRSAGGRIYAYFERPGDSQTWLISKDEFETGDGGWGFEGVPSHGGPVGGRGLGINGPDGRILGGTTQGWNSPDPDDAEVYELSGGSWSLHRQITPSLMWELEFDGLGRLWEFYSGFNDPANVTAVYVDGVVKPGSPGGDLSHACWFDGYMYIVGNLASEGPRNAISRSADGDTWETVHSIELSELGDHVQIIPRDPPELWYTAHHPFTAGYSLDGTTWTREPSLPSFETGTDTNHMTAIAYWHGAVWIFARDEAAGRTRVFADSGAADLLLQVI